MKASNIYKWIKKYRYLRQNQFEEIIMLKLIKKLKYSLFAVLYGMMISVPVVADDIEIYTSAGTTSATSQANVLFVLDTSGSMGTTVQTRDDFDPSLSYAGGLGCYKEDRVYRQLSNISNAFKRCSNSWWYRNYTKEPDLPQVYITSVKCEKAGDFSIGYYTGRVSQYRNSKWRDSISSNKLSKFIECEADAGVHGKNTGDAAVWAKNNGPWSSSSSGKINWGSTGLSTTLYSGRYLNYLINAPVTNQGTRISIMKKVIADLLATTSGVNVGLMRFDRYSNGGMVATPVDDIDKDIGGGETYADTLIDALDDMTANGGTPLSETFYEAALYYQGKSVDYGNNSSPFNSVAGSKTGSAYKSPIADECQKNYVILLTDGEPTNDSLSSTRRAKLNIGSCSGNCLDEIAKSVGTNDQSSTVDGDNFLSTFTIGFAIDNQLLQDTARESYLATDIGQRYLADDAVTLADTLNNIFADIYDTDTTFSSPAVSVNAFNRSAHLDDLYFTLFKPATKSHWPGNFKKYKLDFFVDGDDVNKNDDRTERLPFIADVTGVDAIGENGFFDKDARSFWSSETDGFDVEAGGSARELTSSRKVYTYTGSYTNNSGVHTPPDSSAGLTSTDNTVDKTNLLLDEAMMGIVGKSEIFSGTPRLETLLDWTKGLDVFNEYGTDGTTADSRLNMGDPLHSEPALIQYGGTVDVPDLVAYVATNDGYLHAVDVDDGSTIFSFVPQELLANLDTVMASGSSDKTYGLDGNVVAWINDEDGDGVINGSDHVYLYVGMRRGGNNIYSLDVTDRSNPELRWVIKGGSGDYAELGETWSNVNIGKVKDGSTEKTVLIFGGGYDTAQDGVTIRTADTVGRAVFIADADTGGKLWSAGPGGTLMQTEMKYSVPARIKQFDLKGDGYIDHLYAADMGGQIFRFDIDNTNDGSLKTSITGGLIADLAGSGEENARRFYYPPDVALIAEKGEAAYLGLAISSGYRAHPVDTKIQDRIYMLKDYDVFKTPATYKKLTEADLYNATLNHIGGDGSEAEKAAAKTGLENADGWYIKLDEEDTGNWIGEKGLSEALILDGIVIVTTFTPTNAASTSSSCKPQSGIGKVYYLDTLDASPAYASDADIRSERVKPLKDGIPPSPNVIITKGGEPTICIGTQCELANVSKGVRKTFWYEVEK